jgi:hypothetical protein
MSNIKAKTFKIYLTEVPGFILAASFESHDSLLFERRGGGVDLGDFFLCVCGCSGSSEGVEEEEAASARAAGGEISKEEGEEEVSSLDDFSAFVVVGSFGLVPSESADAAPSGGSRSLLFPLRRVRSTVNDPELRSNVRGFWQLPRYTFRFIDVNSFVLCLYSNGLNCGL